MFNIDALSTSIAVFIGLFSILGLSYALPYMRRRAGKGSFYGYVLLTIAGSFAAVFADNVLLLITAWGFLGFTLYMLINGSEHPQAAATAKKTFILIGATDSIMLLGLAMVLVLSNNTSPEQIASLSFSQLAGAPIALDSPLAMAAFLCFAAAAFAKAGVIPFQSWIPDCAESADIPVNVFLPASLDKLLGIYLLVRVWKDVFIAAEAMMVVLMVIGGITIIAGVMMALIQHDARRLLGYHAVSQVGYMVLGIGTGNVIGIAGGLFHMFNNTLYKTCLFMSAGAVEHRAKTFDLDSLGGLAKAMPVTFMCTLIAALSISGVPPFNGFASKWMIYQGVIERMSRLEAGPEIKLVVLLCLLAAMFGSALTLASFVKLLHAVFLGQSRIQKDKLREIKEAPFFMWLPMVILAAGCIVFGVLAYAVPLQYLIQPVFTAGLEFPGIWQPVLATWLLIIGLAAGGIIYLAASMGKSARTDTAYTGGEAYAEEESLSGTDFYQSVRQLNPLQALYRAAREKTFDIYEQGLRGTFFISRKLQNIHAGFLQSYLLWCLVGVVVLYVLLGIPR